MSSEETLSRDLRIKASMINLGERIVWGSETSLMDAAADRIDALEAECERWKSKAHEIDQICQGLQEIIHSERELNRREALANAESHGKTKAERDEARAQFAAIQGGMGGSGRGGGVAHRAPC